MAYLQSNPFSLYGGRGRNMVNLPDWGTLEYHGCCRRECEADYYPHCKIDDLLVESCRRDTEECKKYRKLDYSKDRDIQNLGSPYYLSIITQKYR